MRRALIALILATGLASAAHAGNAIYSDPYAEPQHGLRFADLEASVARDPRLPSSDPRWDPHHTPSSMLIGATRALRSAIPAGTPAGQAAAALEKAGAHCASASSSELACNYHDVQTPFGGQDFDNVFWHVNLMLADGRVSDLSVARDWTRR